MNYCNSFSLILLCIVLQCIMYFGYNSAYFDYTSLQEFPSFYSENIYQYRVLGTQMFLEFNNLIQPIFENLRENARISKQINTLGCNLYLSLFLFNTGWLLLATWVIRKTLFLKNFETISKGVKELIVIGIILLITLSQYVITPYDNLSYFFLVANLWSLLKYFNTKKIIFFGGYCVILFISTFNRETSALAISMLFALGLYQAQGNFLIFLKRPIIYGSAIFIFLMAYIGIRMYVGENTMVQGNYWIQNFINFKNILGLVFFGIVVSISQKYFVQKQLSLYFLLFSIPYLLMIVLGGILWEIRLFLPILIPFILFGFVIIKSENA